MTLKEKLVYSVPEFDFKEFENDDDFIIICFFAIFIANNIHNADLSNRCADCVNWVYTTKHPEHEAILEQIALTLFDENLYEETFIALLTTDVQKHFEKSIAMWRQGSVQ
ncbi:hypothetical protein [Flavobacterium alkalisoli]|uniref:hypothetical protein n=1 Tax=Flavobacterium alkalisoli TaxID=2602769 RepID=UPI003A919B49